MSRPASNTPRLAVEPGFFAGRGLAELARGMAEGAFSAEDLVRHAGAAIERLNPQLNAFVHTDIPAALAQARALDAERAAGRVRGPLHGIPVAIKDNVDTADMPTTMGAAHFLGHRPAADARCVTLLREAGAIVVGKTLTHEFAYGPTGDRSVQGAARNPWDPARITGGSSAGSAAAVAAGMVPVALGTDTGGSVRVPSALCGLVGFKPSHGRVSDAGVFPLSPSIEDVCAGAARGGRAGVHAHPERRRHRRCRGCERCAAHRLARQRAVRHRSRAGHRLARARRPSGWLARRCWTAARSPCTRALQAALSAIQRSEAYEVHAERVEREPGKYDPEVLERLRASRPVQGWEYVRGLKERARLQTAFARIFEHVDALALPTVAITAPVLQQRSVNGPGSAGVRETLLGLTNPWNVLGLPAISLPAGFVDGLPVGLQLVGPAGADAALLALAARHWKPARA